MPLYRESSTSGFIPRWKAGVYPIESWPGRRKVASTNAMLWLVTGVSSLGSSTSSVTPREYKEFTPPAPAAIDGILVGWSVLSRAWPPHPPFFCNCAFQRSYGEAFLDLRILKDLAQGIAELRILKNLAESALRRSSGQTADSSQLTAARMKKSPSDKIGVSDSGISDRTHLWWMRGTKVDNFERKKGRS